MKLETAKAIIAWEDDDDAENYEEVGKSKQVSKSRWTERLSQVYKHKTDGTFWEILHLNGLTENQDMDDDDRDVQVRQVWPHAVTTTVYKATQPET